MHCMHKNLEMGIKNYFMFKIEYEVIFRLEKARVFLKG